MAAFGDPHPRRVGPRSSASIAALLAILLLAGCGGGAPLPAPGPPPAAATASTPPDHLDLAAVGFDALPGWDDDALGQAIPALRRSCEAIADAPPRQPVGRQGLGGVVADWLAPCGALRDLDPGNGAAVRAYFRSWYQPYRATAAGAATGLLTGYFEADIEASPRPDARHHVPLYARPRDLVQIELGGFDPALAGREIWGRISDGRLVPYPSRAEIDAGAIAGVATPLFWAGDRADAVILEIQGSGRVHLPDGRVVRIGFDGTNGRPYLSLGRILVDAGKLPAGQVDMPAIRAWLEAHPAEAQALIERDPRVVFFKPLAGDAPVGAEGVELTAGRSLAVDDRYVPYGVPVWIDARAPDGLPLRRMVVAQDAGAAIKGPLRGDLFTGAGAAAFDLAGRLVSPGSWYLLLPRQRSGEFALAGAP